MKYNANSIIGQVVADDFRTASIFKNHKIDFCCNGNRNIDEAAKAKNIDIDKVLYELENVSGSTDQENINFDAWPIDLLADYIERIHHKYVNDKVPELLQYLNKIQAVHGEKHPELYEVYTLFQGAAYDLIQHMKKEESILFPYARQMANETANTPPHFGTVQNPVRVMMQEHENEGERFRKIRQLTNDYTPPSDACSTYTVAFAMLEEFENDLHKHIHLENNILFPKTVEMEKLQPV